MTKTLIIVTIISCYIILLVRSEKLHTLNINNLTHIEYTDELNTYDLEYKQVIFKIK